MGTLLIADKPITGVQGARPWWGMQGGNAGSTKGTPVVLPRFLMEAPPPAARGYPSGPGCRRTLGLSEQSRAGKDTVRDSECTETLVDRFSRLDHPPKRLDRERTGWMASLLQIEGLKTYFHTEGEWSKRSTD